MANKEMRTIYLTKDIDQYIMQRMQLEDRTRSSLIERMIKKCMSMEQDKDLEIAMATKQLPDQN